MIYWLAFACRRARERAGRDPKYLVKTYDLPRSTLGRFEEGRTWSRDVEDIVAIYAHAAGIPDARELWAIALRLWFQHGLAPKNEPLSDEIAQSIDRELNHLMTPNTG